MNIAALDLNLLVALDALLAERSVTRAAKRLGLSQPAASHALGRLRAALGDTLLVRTNQGLVPTSRAEALAGPVAEALDRLRAALDAGATFDPGRHRRSFTIAAVDLAQLLLLPTLVECVTKAAPGVELVVRTVPAEDLARRLADGTMDLSIDVPRGIADDLRHLHLLDERLVCVTREGHPWLRVRGTTARRFDAWCDARHVVVVPSGGPMSRVDAALERLQRTRRAAVTVQQFLTAPHLVARSDLVWTAPARMAAIYARLLGLVVSPLPFPVEPFRLQLSWHPRRADDPAHAWLRGQVQSAARSAARATTK